MRYHVIVGYKIGVKCSLWWLHCCILGLNRQIWFKYWLQHYLADKQYNVSCRWDINETKLSSQLSHQSIFCYSYTMNLGEELMGCSMIWKSCLGILWQQWQYCQKGQEHRCCGYKQKLIEKGKDKLTYHMMAFPNARWAMEPVNKTTKADTKSHSLFGICFFYWFWNHFFFTTSLIEPLACFNLVCIWGTSSPVRV